LEDAPILVGIDFSKGSRDALVWAVDAAIAFDAPLCLLHVVHDPAESPGYYRRGVGEGAPDEIQRRAQSMMDEFLTEAREAIDRIEEVRELETNVIVGLPVTRIIEFAEHSGARQIVMGAQGRTALADVLLGSKVDRVTHLAPIPVTIVKPPRAVETDGSSG